MEEKNANSEPGKARTAQLVVVDFFLTVIGITVIGLGAWAIWKGNLALAGTALGAGLLILFAATIDRFESLKGLGIEAKTKKLEASISQAEILTKQLNEVVNFVGSTLVVLTNAQGRMSEPPSVMASYRSAMTVKAMMQKTGAGDAKIREALMPWAKTLAFDAARAIRHEVNLEVTTALNALHMEMIQPNADVAQCRMRIEVLEAYLSNFGKDGSLWSLGEIISEIGRLPEDAPELTNARRAELRGKANALQEQLRYIDDHFEFKDVDFWERFKRNTELPGTL